MQDDLVHRPSTKQKPKPDYPCSDSQASCGEAEPPRARAEVHFKAPHPRKSRSFCRFRFRLAFRPTRVPEPREGELSQVRPKEKLSTAKDGEKAEEARPVVVEQRDISGQLRGGT